MPQIGFTQKCDFRYQDTVRVKLKTWNERYMPCFALTQSTVSFLWRAIITQDCCTTIALTQNVVLTQDEKLDLL